MNGKSIIWFLGTAAVASATAASTLHTFDGKHDIGPIRLTAVYFLPSNRRALPDWRDRANYFLGRLKAFHQRELDGQSTLETSLRPEPFASPETAQQFQDGDPNATFYRTVNAVRRTLHWPPPGHGFPVLLVLSDINWRELDDFRRERVVNGKPVHEGFVDSDGRHFPGADSGGARAVYLSAEGVGLGLVSADGWRVPYSGSDSVVYHEGVGHTIGLPHPEPMDDSVMGTAQYRFWLNQTWLDVAQKRQLGWASPSPRKERERDLFSAFAALPQPLVPAPGESVALQFTWPAAAKVRSLIVRIQTELFGEWRTLSPPAKEFAPQQVALGAFQEPTPVSYRVNATLTDGQQVELWGYFQVKARAR